MPVTVAAAAAISVICLFLGLYRLLKPAGELEDRLESSVRHDAQPADEPPKPSLIQRLKSISLDKKLAGEMAVELTRADIALTVNEYVMIRFGGAAAALLIGSVLGRNLLVGLVLALVALQVPVMVLHFRSKQRQARFQKQLVDVISMLTSGLKAGVGLVQAMDLVRKEMPAPASDEFGRVVREMGLGVSLTEALHGLTDRMPGDDLEMLVTVINIQAEVGGNLATVLDNVITTIRERVRIAQEIKTLTAMQRITSYILAGLPFLLGIAISVINPPYMRPLFTAQWIWMPAVTVVMVGAGFFVISRIVDIKV